MFLFLPTLLSSFLPSLFSFSCSLYLPSLSSFISFVLSFTFLIFFSFFNIPSFPNHPFFPPFPLTTVISSPFTLSPFSPPLPFFHQHYNLSPYSFLLFLLHFLSSRLFIFFLSPSSCTPSSLSLFSTSLFHLLTLSVNSLPFYLLPFTSIINLSLAPLLFFFRFLSFLSFLTHSVFFFCRCCYICSHLIACYQCGFNTWSLPFRVCPFNSPACLSPTGSLP